MKKKSFSYRLMSLLLVALMAFTMLPTAALAADKATDAHIHTEECVHEEITLEAEPVTVDTTDAEVEPVTEITVETEEVIITETEAATDVAEESNPQTAENSLIWTFDEASGTLTIGGTGTVAAINSPDEQPWASIREQIQYVQIDMDAMYFADDIAYWFAGCTNLVYAEVPGYWFIIGEDAFKDCFNLRELLILTRGTPEIAETAFSAESAADLWIMVNSEESKVYVESRNWYGREITVENYGDVRAYSTCGINGCYCSSCSWYKTTSPYDEYDHITYEQCDSCSANEFAYGVRSDHTFSGGYCTVCGYEEPASSCSHSSTYYSWSGCTYYEYCSSCGEYISSGTSHGTYSYGIWEYYSSTRHRRYYSCNDCGEGSYSYGYHSTTTKYTEYSSTQHKYGSYCSTCSSYVGSTSYASHSFSYGSWSNYSSTQHRRTVSCSACGYSSYEYASHSLTYGSWTSYNGTQHRRTVKCSTCSYSSYEYANHSLTTGNWTSVSDTQHSRTTSCSCGYSTTETANHSLNYGTWGSYNDDQHRRSVSCDCGYSSYEYEDHSLSAGEIASTGDANQHEREMSCDCGYVTSVSENHTFTYGAWEDYDDTQHRRTAECDCGYSGYDYAIHIYIYADSLEQKDDVQHYMIHKCEECTHSVKEQENHSFTYGNWEAATESEHSRTVSCRCGYTGEETALHEDLNGDDYCDDCGYLVTRFSVTLPAAMVMTVSEDGEIHTADNVVIVNNSTHAVEITSVTVTAAGDWTLVPYYFNMAAEKVDSKLIGFYLNGAETTVIGDTERLSLPTNWTIDRADTFPLEYDAIVSATSTTMENEQVLTLVFVIDWAPR